MTASKIVPYLPSYQRGLALNSDVQEAARKAQLAQERLHLAEILPRRQPI